ncbi:hypothetical protein JDV02_004758 [Purpureocillium takamizusanense]|uniref:ABM domain-containing protein n=1 Tax=Purpureocillium takamizusanense TaxID=2060973 RepID=A0A9Q8QFV7_9HYPO|nr:uncharacterized protein JDV02_004758 [Purpureocillium takamizusanense]UNI18492.1 hypothetical protein JDV02_004758 [Purpureocillium takamizusanense]
MPVTELAILKLRGGHDQLEFLETLMEVQELQDEWIHENKPCHLEPNANLSSMYVEEADPPSLLITAPWDSPEAHGEWIQSRENQDCNGKLSQYIRPGCDSVLMFHMDAAGAGAGDGDGDGRGGAAAAGDGSDGSGCHKNTAARSRQMRRPFENQRSFNVCRLSVDPAKRDALEDAYRRLEDQSRPAPGAEPKVWGGWRIEKSGDNEDLVVFWSDEVPNERLEPLMSFTDDIIRRRFTHVV